MRGPAHQRHGLQALLRARGAALQRRQAGATGGARHRLQLHAPDPQCEWTTAATAVAASGGNR